YFGYDLARVVEQLPGGPQLGQDVPDLWLAAYDSIARTRGDTTEVIGERWLEQMLATGPERPALPPRLGELVPDDAADLHVARVGRILDYLAAGDVYQVNLARRLVARIEAPGDALALYAALS